MACPISPTFRKPAAEDERKFLFSQRPSPSLPKTRWLGLGCVMKPLRHIAGVLLATMGVFFVLAACALFFDPHRDVPWWMVGVLLVGLGFVPLTGAFLLLLATLTTPERSCPRCGGVTRHAAGVLQRHHNPWMFHFGGWLFASLWGASREQQVRCGQCDTLYLTDTRGSRIAGVVFWIVLLLLLTVAVAAQFHE